MDNVVCTPHIGYVTHEEYQEQFDGDLRPDRGVLQRHADQRHQSGCFKDAPLSVGQKAHLKNLAPKMLTTTDDW